MAGLEDVGLEIRAGSQQIGLGLPLHVAGEQEAG